MSAIECGRCGVAIEKNKAVWHNGLKLCPECKASMTAPGGSAEGKSVPLEVCVVCGREIPRNESVHLQNGAFVCEACKKPTREIARTAGAPQYRALESVASLNVYIGWFILVVGVIAGVVVIVAGSLLQGVFTICAAVVVGIFQVAAGEALAAFRDIAINTWCLRNKS